MIGMPEARIILAHAAVYVATAPKSNSAYLGIDQALLDVENGHVGQVPAYLRDGTSNKLKMKYDLQEENDGKKYLYPHDYPGHYVDQDYLPENLRGKRYFKPSKMVKMILRSSREKRLVCLEEDFGFQKMVTITPC